MRLYIPVSTNSFVFFLYQAIIDRINGRKSAILTSGKINDIFARFLKVQTLPVSLERVKESSFVRYYSYLGFSGDSFLGQKRALPFEVMQKAEISLISRLEHFNQEHSKTQFVIFNGFSFSASIASNFAKTKGISCIYLENGYFPNTTQIDSNGTNSKLSFSGASLSEIRKIIPKYSTSPYHQSSINFRAPKISKALRYTLKIANVLECSFNRSMRVFDETETLLAHTRYLLLSATRTLRSHRKKERNSNTNRISIFFPLQVFDDTQTIFNTNPVSFFRNGYLISFYNHMISSGFDFHIYVREHPKDTKRISYNFLSHLPHVSVDNSTPLPDMIHRSDLVVTVNSTVGFSAALLGKPVIILGDNFYRNLPNVHRFHQTIDINKILTTHCYQYTPEDIASLSNLFLPDSWQSIEASTQVRINNIIDQELQISSVS